MSEIPNAAIEAALKAYGKSYGFDWEYPGHREAMIAALTAAAPFMQHKPEAMIGVFVRQLNAAMADELQDLRKQGTFADGIEAAAQLYEKAHGSTPSAFGDAIRALKPETK